MGIFSRFLRTALHRAQPEEAPGPDSLRIRPMGYRDLDAVFAIENVSFPGPWRVSSFARAVNEPHQHFFVAEAGRRLIGFSGFWVEGPRAHIAKVAVHPDFRRHGLGSALLEHLLAEIRALGLRHAYLEVRKANLGAQELYRRFGFRFDRVQPHAYPEDGEDALIYVWEDLPSPDLRTEH
jgi:[ribosomal protein S18]-alanine N-acetyltransferase